MKEGSVQFKDTVTIVTGASSGIGEACAMKLLDLGASVAGFDVEATRLAHAAYKHFAVDVRDEGSVSSAVAEVHSNFDKIDALVNCAGIFSVSKPFYEMTMEEWGRVIGTNLTGTFLCAKHVSLTMCERKKGKIVNIGCIRSRIVRPGMAEYSASKGGVMALTAAMALDLAKFNIQVNSVAPGFTLTGMSEKAYKDPAIRQEREKLVPLGRVAMPSEIANVVMFLLSEASDYITGETIFVDGGFKVSG